MPRTSAKSRDLDRGIGGQYAYETETQGKLHSMVDKESPLVHRHLRHLPGDTVQIEIGFFRHGMNLKEVLATFEHAIDKPFEITLRGHPEPVRTDFVSRRLGKHLGRFASSLPFGDRRGRLEVGSWTIPLIPLDANTSPERTKFSRVILSATVPGDAPPGIYRCARLEALTFGGRRLPFHPFTEERWRKWHFLVLSEEEGTLPSF